MNLELEKEFEEDFMEIEYQIFIAIGGIKWYKNKALAYALINFFALIIDARGDIEVESGRKQNEAKIYDFLRSFLFSFHIVLHHHGF